jgi:hypothetical protein
VRVLQPLAVQREAIRTSSPNFSSSNEIGLICVGKEDESVSKLGYRYEVGTW